MEIKMDKLKVWIVTQWNGTQEPIVSPFSNEEAAQAYYRACLKNDRHFACIDECEVYSKYYDGSKWIPSPPDEN